MNLLNSTIVSLPATEEMKQLLLIATVLVFQQLIGQNSSTVFDFEAFTITADSSWKKLNLRGVDSYVDGISNGKDSITFDFSLKKELGNLSLVFLIKQGFQADIKNRLALIGGKMTIVSTHQHHLRGTTNFFSFMLPFRKYTLFFSSNQNSKEVRRIIASCRLTRLKMNDYIKNGCR